MIRTAILLPAMAFALFLLSPVGTFGQSAFFDPCARLTLGTSAPNQPSDMHFTFGVGVGPDCQQDTGDDDAVQYMPDQVVLFTPPDWTIGEVPVGVKVGTETSPWTAGLLNSGCLVRLNVPMDLLAGAIDRSRPIEAKPPGQPDRLSPLARDADANGIPDGAERWPTYLDGLASQRGMDLSKLIARVVGFNTTSVSGTTVVVNYLIFEPGAQIASSYTVDPALGYPMVRILQDPGAPTANFDPLSDLCSPYISEVTLFGDVEGDPFRRNPGDGAYSFLTFVTSAPDGDGDGIENALDPCPTVADTTWDPRAPKTIGQPGDADGDGLPDSCDPLPTHASICDSESGIAGADEDCDGWMNRGDNCPLTFNVRQEDEDRDGLGAVCDPNDSLSGLSLRSCLVRTAFVGEGGLVTFDPTQVPPCAPSACGDGSGLCPTTTPTSSPPSPPPTLTKTPVSLPEAGREPPPGKETVTVSLLIGVGLALTSAGVAVALARREH